MAVESTKAGAATEIANPRLLREVVELLRQATDESSEWAARIAPNASLEGDLAIESVELAVLGDLLSARYGDRVDLPAFVAGLDIDQIIGLTVADLVAYVAGTAAPHRSRA